MRYFSLVLLTAAGLLVPAAHAREQQDLRERVRDAVQRTDKDLGSLVPRDKLDAQQRDRFDAVMKDLHELSDGVENGKWQNERDRLEDAIDKIDDLVKHAPIQESDRQTLGIDLYTLRTIRDSWKQ